MNYIVANFLYEKREVTKAESPPRNSSNWFHADLFTDLSAFKPWPQRTWISTENTDWLQNCTNS